MEPGGHQAVPRGRHGRSPAPRPVQLVTSATGGELAALVAGLASALPGRPICVTPVAAGDTLSTGIWVAELALVAGWPPSCVVHDVEPAWDRPGGERRVCMGRTDAGVLVVGPNAGWSWSFVAGAVREVYYADVAIAPPPLEHATIAVVARHAVARHPHAVAGVVPQAAIPPIPAGAAAGLPAEALSRRRDRRPSSGARPASAEAAAAAGRRRPGPPPGRPRTAPASGFPGPRSERTPQAPGRRRA